jgi:CheY-like chemotaxis protein
MLGLETRVRADRGQPPAPGAKDTATKRKTRGGAKEADAAASETLDLVLRELRAIREMQEHILDALRTSARPLPFVHASAESLREEGPSLSAIRAQSSKSVVLVDDDPRTREAAVAELMQANVPVRAFDDGNAALQAIAEEKPDVVALELGLGGEMGGKDVINMIKATMEWVDIPVILWTREAVSSQKEARQVHGADEVVPKSSGAAALVARVITLFRRG